MRRPVVVVGAGAAGLATALAAAPVPVVLVCRGRGADGSASALAQGGIAAALGAGDAVQAHARDTREAGAWHNATGLVDWLCARAPATVSWLAAQGVEFDRDPAGGFRLGREGGHHAARIVHAGGDATGAVLVRALEARARAAAHIDWREVCDADALLLGDGRVLGVRVRDARGREEHIPAAAVCTAPTAWPATRCWKRLPAAAHWAHAWPVPPRPRRCRHGHGGPCRAVRRCPCLDGGAARVALAGAGAGARRHRAAPCAPGLRRAAARRQSGCPFPQRPGHHAPAHGRGGLTAVNAG